MSAITPHTLATLLKGVDEGEMVAVRVKDETGFRYWGRITSMQEVKAAPRASTFDVEAEDGEMVWAQPVSRIIAVDVRPFQRYSGYSVQDFIDAASAGMEK